MIKLLTKVYEAILEWNEFGKNNSNFYEWKKSNIQNIPEKTGVYGLFENMKGECLIYIGSSSGLRERIKREV